MDSITLFGITLGSMLLSLGCSLYVILSVARRFKSKQPLETFLKFPLYLAITDVYLNIVLLLNEGHTNLYDKPWGGYRCIVFAAMLRFGLLFQVNLVFFLAYLSYYAICKGKIIQLGYADWKLHTLAFSCSIIITMVNYNDFGSTLFICYLSDNTMGKYIVVYIQTIYIIAIGTFVTKTYVHFRKLLDKLNTTQELERNGNWFSEDKSITSSSIGVNGSSVGKFHGKLATEKTNPSNPSIKQSSSPKLISTTEISIYQTANVIVPEPSVTLDTGGIESIMIKPRSNSRNRRPSFNPRLLQSEEVENSNPINIIKPPSDKHMRRASLTVITTPSRANEVNGTEGSDSVGKMLNVVPESSKLERRKSLNIPHGYDNRLEHITDTSEYNAQAQEVTSPIEIAFPRTRRSSVQANRFLEKSIIQQMEKNDMKNNIAAENYSKTNVNKPDEIENQNSKPYNSTAGDMVLGRSNTIQKSAKRGSLSICTSLAVIAPDIQRSGPILDTQPSSQGSNELSSNPTNTNDSKMSVVLETKHKSSLSRKNSRIGDGVEGIVSRITSNIPLGTQSKTSLTAGRTSSTPPTPKKVYDRSHQNSSLQSGLKSPQSADSYRSFKFPLTKPVNEDAMNGAKRKLTKKLVQYYRNILLQFMFMIPYLLMREYVNQPYIYLLFNISITIGGPLNLISYLYQTKKRK
ncbi:hypothetical protein BC833DRAFT_652849 [Globomyces pollinis-pini]|nr:hypothetical protein BC833DRAFT_652849 [Globomyces pollinis-pini]